MASWRRSFRLHLRGGTVEQDVEEEISFHLDQRTRELMAEGMSPSAAREEALRVFGDAGRVRRECQEIGRRRERGRRRLEAFSELRQDATFALRQLRKAPGFTLVAVLTLALGIGATAAIFSILYAVVLRPLPFPHPERLVHLWAVDQGEDARSISPGNFLELRRSARSFEHLSASPGLDASFNLTGDGEPERIVGSRVSAGHFATFGVRPALGRTFSAPEDEPGRNQVAVLSHQLWRGRFGANPEVVGRSILLNGLPHAVIGVMPAAFDLQAKGTELWVPLALGADEEANYGHSYLRVLGRLKPGVSPAEAGAELVAIAKRLEEISPESNKSKGLRVEPYVDRLLGGWRKRLLVLLGAVGCVLLIACVNVANLLLARGAARSREMAVRAALGAGQGRIVRQLLTESLVLGLAGAVAGVGVAFLGLRFLVAIGPPGVPRLDQAAIDGTVLACTMALGLAASVLFGLVPALRTARPDLQSMIKEGGRSLGTGAPRDRVRSALLAAEVALALVLLAGAGLLIQSAVRLDQVETGFDSRGVLTAQLALPGADYPEVPRALATVERVIAELEGLPGVESAAATSILPLSGWNTSSTTEIEGHPRERGEELDGSTRTVSRGYFRTMGIPLLRGRDFTAADREGAPRVVIVNETLARIGWPGEDPIGKRLSYYTDDEDEPVWHEVVAVAGDIRQTGLNVEVRPELYIALAQSGSNRWGGDQSVSVALAVKTAGDPAGQTSAVRQAVRSVDPRLPIFAVATMEEIRRESVATTRFNMLLLTALGLIGLVLAAVGIYGVIAYFVSQRTQEIGLRMALGATQGRVLAMVVLQALRPVLVGLVVGVAGAAVATRLLSSLLFGVTATDPPTFAGVVLVLFSAALLASYLPAQRAARVDPTRALAP